MSNYVSIIEWFGGDEPHKCGYCKTPSSISEGMWCHIMTPRDYQSLIDRGWRRSGKYCYKPNMKKTCCPQYTIRCNMAKFHVSRTQKRVISAVNRYLQQGTKGKACENGEVNGGSKQPAVTGNSVSSEEINRISLEQAQPTKSIDLNHPIKRHSESKARQKRILRRLAKGKTVEKGVLRDPPKNLEKRLTEGVKMEQLSKSEFKLIGAAHELQVRLIYISSPEDNETRSESHQVYQKYQVKIHGDDANDVGERQWRRFLLDNPFREEPDLSATGSKLPLGLYHCHYRLDGKE